VISRKTIISFLLALLLAVSIKAYTLRIANPCDAYLSGQLKAPATVVMNQQGRPYLVPCNDWFLRQTRSVQVFCLVDAGIFVVFLVSAFADWRRRRASLRATES
jgi:hypothetical protein